MFIQNGGNSPQKHVFKDGISDVPDVKPAPKKDKDKDTDTKDGDKDPSATGDETGK